MFIVASSCTVSCVSSCDDSKDFSMILSERVKAPACDVTYFARDVVSKNSPISKLA